MRIPHALAALGAAVLIPLIVAVPAHADETFAGTVDGNEQSKVFTMPDFAADRCNPDGLSSGMVPYDVVEFVSQTTGPRRIVLTGATPDLTGVEPFVLYAYRNGECVAADYALHMESDEDAERAAGILDLDNVAFAVGDKVRIEIVAGARPAPWTLRVLQPGTASVSAAAVGNAGTYVGLAPQIDCNAHTTPVTIMRRLIQKVGAVRWVKIKTDGATLKKLKGTTLSRVVRRAKWGQPYVVTGIPGATRQLSVEIKLDNGKKKTLTRSYSAC